MVVQITEEMIKDQNNEELVKRLVRDYMKITDPKEFDKWEKFFIFIMLN